MKLRCGDDGCRLSLYPYHTSLRYSESFPPPVLDWVKIGVSVFLPINFIVNMLWIEQ